jgi:coenzyme F420-dependent glucose-6-phosphate dehydrogenase
LSLVHPANFLGFHCSHEQHSPSRLLALLRHAEAAGFRAGMCSDHFHPWTARNGHSGAAWSWLGAALQATSMTLGTVCAPGQRYHPAIVAQAAATLAEMYPDRLWVTLGTGEALNEAITGDPWPSKATRTARLRESVSIMRALWNGEEVTARGHVTVERARLYTRPARPPMIVGAALTPETAREVGAWADGLITAAGPREATRTLVEAFREGGGDGKPMWLQVALSYAPTDAEARNAAIREWPHSALSTTELADLPTPEAFDAASARVQPDDVLRRVRASADIERHRAWIEEDLALGFSRVYLHNVARDHQERFIDAVGRSASSLVP